VWPLVSAAIERCAAGIRWMRDPTRGGVATALNELVRGQSYGVALSEDAIPVHDAVRGACELLGLDVLHIANEGQFLAVVSEDVADDALAAIRAVPGGEGAVCIGEIREKPPGQVVGVSGYGGMRAIDMLVGDPLPRVC
jgi:hydrogenase expression/formation protein HypE